MIAIWAAIALQAAPELVLDARPDAPRCDARTAGEDIVVCARDDRPTTLLDATIDATPVQILVEPGGPDTLECNPAIAERAGIAGNGSRLLSNIGPVDIYGTQAEIRLVVAGREHRTDMQWSSRPVLTGADCIAGPRALPFVSIRFLLGPPRPEATAVTLPFHRPSYGHLNVRWQVGDHDLAVRFELAHARSVLAASSARAVAPTLGATATGPVLEDEIAWLVMRPVRRLETRLPLVVGNLTVAAPHVRVEDYGDATNLRSIDPQDLAPDDILVSAKRGRPGGTRLVRIGRDDLSRCVSITVDRRARQLTLVC